MRRFCSIFISLTAIIVSAVFLLYPMFTAEKVQGEIEAAMILKQQATQKGDCEVVFRSENGSLSLEDTFAALEAVYPYAFSIGSVERANGTNTLSVTVPRLAQQEQAQTFAEAFAADTVLPGMTDREKLRALHDALIRLCVYDSATAEDMTADGSEAPFSADGALIGHKAVCSGYGRAFVMLCNAAGIDDVIYVASLEMNHGFNAVRLDGETLYIDCTFDDPVPDQGEYVSDGYFLKTAEEMQLTHVWDEVYYEKVLDFVAG